MSVDKAKDTSPKEPMTENKIVEAKPENSTKAENRRDATPKKQGMGEGQKPVSKAYKDTGTTFLGRRKSDSSCCLLHGDDLCSRGSFSVVVRWRCWERLSMLIQVGCHASSFHPANEKMTTSPLNWIPN
jgi:hypothetical protein